MIRTFCYKLYPNTAQAKTLERWLRTCCAVYNRALEQRIKAYRRRGESVTYNQQQVLLTEQRARIDSLRLVQVGFARDALRRVDRGFAAFFRRLKAGQKSGFPRFRSWRRYTSLEYVAIGQYLQGDQIRIPNLGQIRCRGRLLPLSKQKILRILHQASGWYAQIVLDDGRSEPIKRPVQQAVGIDVGLNIFAALSIGEKIDNPRWARRAERKQRALQRRMSRRKKGNQRRTRAVHQLRQHYELIADRRRCFCHKVSTRLVRQYDLIAIEKLNVKGLSRSRFAKSILDAAWSTFTSQLRYKAEYAGTQLVEVDPRYTSQECPDCGAIKPKSLSERVHRCHCGCVLDRDVAANRVILARALASTGAERPWRESTSTQPLVATAQAGPVKREDVLLANG